MVGANELTACEAARQIAKRELTSVALVEACLARVSEREEAVRAWTYLDQDYAMAQARYADKRLVMGEVLGPLHGVPVAIKDILDTADMPTENGTPVHEGRQPEEDAHVVEALRKAGAVIMGKTVTTELAVFHPGKTRNPHDQGRTPGGSSSGSAAAVASCMVPVGLGTQTAGSILRPASYCGVYGFKPTFGLVPRIGCLNQSPALDTIGPLARSVEDLAFITDIIAAYDPRDGASWQRGGATLTEIATRASQQAPRLAFIKTPMWSRADATAQEALLSFISRLGQYCDEVDLPEDFAEAWTLQRLLQWRDVAKNYGLIFDGRLEMASPKMRELIEIGEGHSDAQYAAAREKQEQTAVRLEELLAGFDAFVMLASPGPAPQGLEATGDPVFNALATFAGMPAVSLPLMEVEGLPCGVQLIGARQRDGELLSTARWLSDWALGDG